MNKKYFPLLSIALLFTACSAYQMQEAASQDVRKIRKSLTAARKEIKALSPSLVTDIKKVNEKEFASIAEKLSYIEKETLKLKVNQANQLRDTGGVAETLEEISSKLEEYNHRVSTITQRLDSIDSRISQLSDVYQTIAGNTEGNASDKKLTRERENMRWTNMGDSILAIQADLAELKTHIDALQAKKGKKSKGPKGKNPPPPFKATLKPPAAVVVPKTPPKRKEVDVTGKLKPLSRIINITPEELYNTAYKDYLKGNFDLSITEFDQYVKKYPDTEASANARYWLGESHYAKKSYAKAIETFNELLKKHPKSIKTPSAMLKTSYSHLNLGQNTKAKELLTKLVASFPNSGEAELAKDTLATLKK